MTRTIHGKAIELEEDLAVADGQQVEIILKTVPAKRQWGEGLHRCAGGLGQ